MNNTILTTPSANWSYPPVKPEPTIPLPGPDKSRVTERMSELYAAQGLPEGVREAAMDLLVDRQIEKATTPRPWDNEHARDLRSQYKGLLEKVRCEQAGALETAEELGEGEHCGPNGSTIEVDVCDESGTTTVTTTNRDGSTKSVTTGPDGVRIEETDAEGRTTVTSKRAGDSEISVEKEGGFGSGGTYTQTFGLDEEGRPYRELESGPIKMREVANPDGSTDTTRAGSCEVKHRPGKPWPGIPVDPVPLPPLPPMRDASLTQGVLP